MNQMIGYMEFFSLVMAICREYLRERYYLRAGALQDAQAFFKRAESELRRKDYYVLELACLIRFLSKYRKDSIKTERELDESLSWLIKRMQMALSYLLGDSESTSQVEIRAYIQLTEDFFDFLTVELLRDADRSHFYKTS